MLDAIVSMRRLYLFINPPLIDHFSLYDFCIFVPHESFAVWGTEAYIILQNYLGLD